MGNWNRNFKYPSRRARSLCCPTWRLRRPHLLLLVQNNYEATDSNHLQVLCETIMQLPMNPQAASAGQDPGKGEFSCPVGGWECRQAQPPWRTKWGFLKNIKNGNAL